MSLPPNQFSQNQKEPESNDLTSMIKIIWVPIIGFIGGVTSIVKFIELWRGDRELVTIVTITIGIIALVFSLLYIGYSKKQSPVYARRQIPRYPSFFRLARIGLLALVVATISGGMLLYRQDLMLQDKLVILIANFDGPDSENYRITEYLLASLKKNLNRNKEIVIKPLNKEITEQEGSEVARKTGREHRADIIVWGWYGVTETDVVVSFHMENLLNSGRDFKTKPEQGVYWFTDERPDNSIAINSDQDQITVSESGNLNSFTVQANLSSEILTIINFFSGYVQYTAGNYNEAVSLFDNAIDESRNLQSWPLKSELHFYRSNANFQLRNLEQSILDLTLAIDISEDIKLKSQYYTNRGVVNTHAGFYEDAISDYSEAIQLDPESPLLFMNYNNRGESHRNLGNYDDAIEDFTKSIQLFSEYEGPFYNRGLTYAQLGMFDKAIPDLNQAINLKPNNYDAYFVLGRIYVEMDEIDKAIFNLNKAIELNPQNANYYVFRGAVQCDSGNRKEGREDLLKAIDLDGNGNDGQMAEYMLNNLCTLP